MGANKDTVAYGERQKYSLNMLRPPLPANYTCSTQEVLYRRQSLPHGERGAAMICNVLSLATTHTKPISGWHSPRRQLRPVLASLGQREHPRFIRKRCPGNDCLCRDAKVSRRVPCWSEWQTCRDLVGHERNYVAENTSQGRLQHRHKDT